jgi:DNA (cytosine-5)-methyltransferase 1
MAMHAMREAQVGDRGTVAAWDQSGGCVNYRSVCSGIEAASVAWEPLGWRALSFSEIDPFPSSVLAHRYPNVPNLGDMTRFAEWSDDDSTDILVGGTPCQSFSFAGLRGGLADPRGNLALVYLGILDKSRPKWFVWENVPGVLSSNGGRDFGSILGAMGQLGYGFAYRVLDAQHFGVPQRRRRVFVVGHLGDWRRAAAVLFEPESLCGNPAKGRESKQEIAGTVTSGSGRRRGSGVSPESVTVATLDANYGRLQGCSGQDAGHGHSHLVAHSLRGEGFDASEDGTGRGTPLVPVHGVDAVRRLTPRECERLQGFPDDWTLVPHRGKPAADGPRYKAIGNSMAVPVMRWIGERIQAVHSKFSAATKED